MVRLICLAALLGVSSLAQDPAAILQADAQQRVAWATLWLQSSDPRVVAWGAWLARQDRMESLVPLLVDKIVAYTPGSDRDRHDAVLAVLDAVIELRANVPVKDARKLFPEFAGQSLILLLRSPDDNRAELLEILDSAQANWNWLAAGNALAKLWPPGFAARLLSRFTQHLRVDVYDPGHGGGSGGGGSECGFSLVAPKAGWPRVGLYLLMQFPDRFPRRKATFLVGGETSVYYYRAETGSYDNPRDNRGYCDDGNRDRYRAQYLSRFGGVDAYPELSLDWRGTAEYRQELCSAVAERKEQLRRLKYAAGLQDRDPGPRLEVVIRDERVNPTDPLPAVLNDGDDGVTERREFTKPRL